MSQRVTRAGAVLALAFAVAFAPPVFARLFALDVPTSAERAWLWGVAAVLGCSALALWRGRSVGWERATLVLGALLAVVACELGARIVVRAVPEWREQSLRHARIAEPETWRYRAHPFLQYVGNSGYVAPLQYNAVGFVGEELERAKPPGTARVLCFGGSTTELGYPAYLEAALRAAAAPGTTWQVMNFGVSGYTSAHNLIALALEGFDYAPDYVVLLHGWNDPKPASDGKPLANYRSDFSHVFKAFEPPRPPDLPLLRASVLYREGKFAWRPLDDWGAFRAATQWVGEHPPPTRYASPGELDVFWRNTRSFLDLALARGIVPVVVTMPHSTDPSMRSFEDGAFIAATNQVLRERVPKLGDSVLFVDLDREMSGRNDLFEDVAHTTETGKRLKGERIAAVIREHRARAAAPPR